MGHTSKCSLTADTTPQASSRTSHTPSQDVSSTPLLPRIAGAPVVRQLVDWTFRTSGVCRWALVASLHMHGQSCTCWYVLRSVMACMATTVVSSCQLGAIGTACPEFAKPCMHHTPSDSSDSVHVAAWLQMWSMELHRRLQQIGADVQCYAVHPGTMSVAVRPYRGITSCIIAFTAKLARSMTRL